MDTPAARDAARKPMSPLRALWASLKLMREQGTPISQVIANLRRHGPLATLQLSFFAAAVERIRLAILDGDLDRGVQLIGQAQGLIDDVPSCDELMQRLMHEADASFTAVAALSGHIAKSPTQAAEIPSPHPQPVTS